MLEYQPNSINRLLLPVLNGEDVIPTTVITGRSPGKTVLIAAGVHCREYVGIQATITLCERLSPENVAGKIIIAHCCNYSGFEVHSNDIVPSDGKNLNRIFPGNPKGTAAERIAATLTQLIENSDYVLDLHCGGSYESLVPHIYYPIKCEEETAKVSLAMACHADVPFAVGSTATAGLYSYAALLGKGSILLERGQHSIWSYEEAAQTADDVENVLRFLNILEDGKSAVAHQPWILKNHYHEPASASGCWYPKKEPGQPISVGDPLGEVRNMFGEVIQKVVAKSNGILLYQTSALAITKGEPIIAYAEL